MGELKFNHELSVFEEHDDPLNSLLLEDLKSLSLTNPNLDESEHSDSNLVEQVCSFLGMSPSSFGSKSSKNSKKMSRFRRGRDADYGSRSLLRSPSKIELEIDNVSTASATSNSDGSKSAFMNGDDQNIKMSIHNNTSNEYSAWKQQHFDTQMNFFLQEKKNEDKHDSCTYEIPHIQRTPEKESLPTANPARMKIKTELKSEQCFSGSIDRPFAVNSLKQEHKPCTSPSSHSTQPSLFSKILPKWLRRRQDKKRLQKEAISQAREAKRVLDQCAAKDECESIASALSMYHIHDTGTPGGLPVIENLDSLDLFSSIGDPCSSPPSIDQQTSPSSSKSKQLTKIKAIVIKPKAAQERSRSDTFTIMKISRESTTGKKILTRSQSDSHSTPKSLHGQLDASRDTWSHNRSKSDACKIPTLASKDFRSGATTIIKPRPMHQRTQSDCAPQDNRKKTKKTKMSKPRSMHRRAQSDSPVITGTYDQNDHVYARFSTPEKARSHNSYVSHLFNTPTSNATSQTSPSSRSVSSTLQNPANFSFCDSQSDSSSVASSVASGVSLAESCSSVYTALSNISYKDPMARPSKILKRSNLKVPSKGDGDIWVEKVFVSKRTGKRRIFFVSVATGRRSRDEPPTGASKIIYQEDLRELIQMEREEQQSARQEGIPRVIGGTSAI